MTAVEDITYASEWILINKEPTQSNHKSVIVLVSPVFRRFRQNRARKGRVFFFNVVAEGGEICLVNGPFITKLSGRADMHDSED